MLKLFERLFGTVKGEVDVKVDLRSLWVVVGIVAAAAVAITLIVVVL